MKLDFDRFWQYKSKFYAEKFLQQCVRASQSLKYRADEKGGSHAAGTPTSLLNWFEAKGLSQGLLRLQQQSQTAFKKAYGFSEFETAQVALYHHLRDYANQMLPTDSGEEANFFVPQFFVRQDLTKMN